MAAERLSMGQIPRDPATEVDPGAHPPGGSRAARAGLRTISGIELRAPLSCRKRPEACRGFTGTTGYPIRKNFWLLGKTWAKMRASST